MKNPYPKRMIDEVGNECFVSYPKLKCEFMRKYRERCATNSRYKKNELYCEIADALDVSVDSVKHWIKGHNGIGSYERVKKLADVLGIPVSKIMAYSRSDENAMNSTVTEKMKKLGIVAKEEQRKLVRYKYWNNLEVMVDYLPIFPEEEYQVYIAGAKYCRFTKEIIQDEETMLDKIDTLLTDELLDEIAEFRPECAELAEFGLIPDNTIEPINYRWYQKSNRARYENDVKAHNDWLISIHKAQGRDYTPNHQNELEDIIIDLRNNWINTNKVY